MPLIPDTNFRSVAVSSAPMDMDFSNDGSLLAIATLERRKHKRKSVIQVFRTEDGSVVREFPQPSDIMGRGCALLDGGRELVFLLWQYQDHTARLYRVDIEGGEPVEIKMYPPGLNEAIIRDRKARYFAVVGRGVEIWDAESKTVIRSFETANRSYYTPSAFSAGGSKIYIYGTVEKAVVRYDVESGKETGRWEAPTPFGSQVVITPDERFLLIAGTSHKGVFVYDLLTGERVLGDENYTKFDENYCSRPWATSFDSNLFMTQQARVRTYQLPTLTRLTVPELITVPSVHSWSAAWAWDAPIVAFGTNDCILRWFSLVEATPTTP